MDFNTIATLSPLYRAAKYMSFALLMLLTLVLAAYNTPQLHARHYDVETGTSVQFPHTIMLTTLTTMGQPWGFNT